MNNQPPVITNYPVEPMQEMLSKLMITMTLDKDGDHAKSILAELESDRFYLMYSNWINAVPFSVTDQLRVFLFFVIAESSGYRPFGFDIFLGGMAKHSTENDLKEWTMQDFASFLPNGYPSESTMDKIWDDLKEWKNSQDN